MSDGPTLRFECRACGAFLRAVSWLPFEVGSASRRTWVTGPAHVWTQHGREHADDDWSSDEGTMTLRCRCGATPQVRHERLARALEALRAAGRRRASIRV